MLERLNKPIIRFIISFFIFSIIALWITPILKGANDGYDSPEKVFLAAQEAGANKDFGSLAKLVAPSEQAMLAFGTDMAVGMFAEFYEGEKAEELKKKYEEIQNKYKINSENEAEGETLQITQETPQEVIDEHIRKRAKNKYGNVDVVKYVPDLMEIVINMPEMAEQSFFPQEDLKDLKIEGDIATGKAGDKNISFIHENGSWYLTADVME